MYNLKDIDLIGKKIIIENSSDKTKIGKNGLVIFETKKKIVIKSKSKTSEIKKSEMLKVVVYE